MLTFALGSVHYTLYDIFSDEGRLSAVLEILFFLLALAPSAMAGLLAGYLSRSHGIAIGTISMTIAAIGLYGITSAADNWIYQSTLIVIGGLSGGCGQLLARK